MLSVPIENWLRTGVVGTLKPGDSSRDVLNALGPPPLAGPKHGMPIPGYWLYGVVEFGFTETGTIEWIQADTVNIDSPLHASSMIVIDWQGIHHNMSIDACKKWLRDHNLAYRLEPDGDGGRLTIENITQLLFCDEADPVVAVHGFGNCCR